MSLARFFAIAACVAVLPGAPCDGALPYGARAFGPPVAGRLTRPDLATSGPWGDRVPPIFAARRPEAGATLRRDHSSGQAGGRDGRAPKSKRNRLARESSAYLLQHAGNPIDWYPWGDEAFRVAKKENKPVFLSIGYLTCHWCQVMEEESFSHPEVAKILNESFVAIKVDREERPDVDATYMAAARLLVENAGWPLNVFLTPGGDAFYATTYLPREDRDGETGLVTLLSRLAETWRDRREQIVSSAELVASALDAPSPTAGALDDETLERGFRELVGRFDPEHGGFLPAPKFLAPNELRFLLRYWYRSSEPEALRIVDETLRAIRRSPIYDTIGFGFHRYASEASWNEPHFEKMLYDQALMAIVATEAFQATGRAEHRLTAIETLDGMLAAFRSFSGAFHAALDARSGGREGAFYRWTASGLAAAAGDEADLARAVFRLRPDGALALDFDPETTAKRFDVTSDQMAARVEALRQRLLDARNRRPHPAVDEKILADWNGLAIAALAKAGAAFGEPRFAQHAKEAAGTVLRQLRSKDGSLLHAAGRDSRGVPAMAEDYAFVAWGFLELYEATGEARWLSEAIRLETEAQRALRGSGVESDAGDAPRLPRQLVVTDTAVPSAAAVRISNRVRLARMTGDEAWNDSARTMLAGVSATLPANPSLASALLSATELAISPSVELVLAGDPASAAMRSLRRAAFDTFTPHKVVLHHSGDENDPIERLAPFTDLYGSAARGRALAFVCVDRTCHLPTSDPQRLREQLRDLPRRPR